MFGSGNRLEILRIIALQSGYIGHPELAGKKRIFAIGFLAPAPTRVAEDVDVGRPEIEAEENVVVPLTLRLIVLGTTLGGNRFAHSVNQVRIPRGRHADRLRKHGGITGA